MNKWDIIAIKNHITSIDESFGIRTCLFRSRKVHSSRREWASSLEDAQLGGRGVKRFGTATLH